MTFTKTRRTIMEYLIPIALVAVFVILQIWVLPKLGVPT